MNVLVDTSVWSLVLRRLKSNISEETAIAEELKELIKEMRVSIIGPVRQEILSGISDKNQFDKLKDFLRPFSDLPIETDDYEKAAEFYNICRKSGIQGSHIDFLICAIAVRYELEIFTSDKDFLLYSKYLPVTLYGNYPVSKKNK
ncbi:MAG: PIN domain-containing protein [Candidatus Eremiobacterota bacterium]